jgi:hypothetical protein
MLEEEDSRARVRLSLDRRGRRYATVSRRADVHGGQHGRHVHALAALLGVGVAAANGQRATGADDLTVRHDAVTGRRRQQAG